MREAAPRSQPVEKLATGIPGFDVIAEGGLPRGRTTLVAGTAGSAKTVFSTQFLAEGIQQVGEAGVFVTFEEFPEDIRRNMISFGWDIARWEEEGRWAFVDASVKPEDGVVEVGVYDLGGLLVRLENAIRKVGAKRVSIDSLNALFVQLCDRGVLRAELFRIAQTLKRLDVTTVFTAERTDDYGELTLYGVEGFVADNVVVLRNQLIDERRRRTIEILKFRGTVHQRGEFPFTVLPGEGIVVIPLSALRLAQRSSSVRVTSGNPVLDEMCGGGFFRDSIILVSGATGTGKTLLVTQFAGGGAAGERCLLFAFEESREQLIRNAGGWGVDFEQLEREGTLRVVAAYPHAKPLEDHLLGMKAAIEEFSPQRIAVDSLSALERTTTIRSYREFVINLTSSIKQQEIPGLITSTAPSLSGETSITEKHISTLTDSIILLRYVEIRGEMRRGLMVLKMRGSMHEKSIREFTIDSRGMHLGAPFRSVSGILSGQLTHFPDEGEDLAVQGGAANGAG